MNFYTLKVVKIVFLTHLQFLCNNQEQTFIFHSNMQKVVEEFIYFYKLSHIHSPIGYSFTLSIFQKLDFPFYTSYCHMKTVPPLNTFDFFIINLKIQEKCWLAIEYC